MNAPKRLKLSETEDERLHPILPDDLTEDTPLVDVYVDVISNPRNISKVIVELNALLPISCLTHLKRVKSKDVLLFPTTECAISDVHDFLIKKNFDVSYLRNEVRIVQVAKVPPKVRKQYNVVNKLWPCNFHSDKYLEKLSTNSVFAECDIDKHENYMRVAIEIFKFVRLNYNAETSNAVIIVDPKIDSVVASGFDNLKEGPCQHAIMVAIDNVAKTQNGGSWHTYKLEPSVDESPKVIENKELNINGIPNKILQHLRTKFPSLAFGATVYKSKLELESPVDGPYLCTGYYVYTLQEPCVMCSMGLVHSRIKRVFYGIPTRKGGLGTLCKVHTVKDLNHHFEVFSGLLKDECSSL